MKKSSEILFSGYCMELRSTETRQAMNMDPDSSVLLNLEIQTIDMV